MMKEAVLFVFVITAVVLLTEGEYVNELYVENYQGNETEIKSCYGGKAECNGSNIIKVQRGYWVGQWKDKGWVIGLCTFCRSFYNSTTHVGELMNVNLHNQCADNRDQSSVMCSTCNENYSIAINSENYDCVECNKSEMWLYFVLNVTILLVFLLFIFIFDFSLVSGALNPLIFFGQMTTTTLKLDMYGAIPISSSFVNSTANCYQIVNAFWKLDLTYFKNNFCFAKDMEMVSVLALKYIVALMALLPVVALILVAKNLDKISDSFGRCLRRLHFSESIAAAIANCSCFSRLAFINRMIRFRRDSSIPTLVAACVILSFPKLNIITFYLLAPTNLYDSDGTVIDKVLYLEGKLEYPGNMTHWRFAWLAIFFLITVIMGFPFILLALRYNHTERQNNASTKFGHIMWYLDKFLDKCLLVPFQKDLKDKKYRRGTGPCSKFKIWRFSFGIHDYRWYAGWYLFLRSSLFATSIFSMDYASQLILQQILITLALGITVTLRPYKQTVHNRLDAFIFLLILIINFTVFYQYQLTFSKSPSNQVYIIQYVLSFIPSFLILIYFFIKLCNNWRSDRYSMHPPELYYDQSSYFVNQNPTGCIERYFCSCNCTLCEQTPLMTQAGQ
ncbi:PREDICTED: uncharacterized protein LOC100631544 isoform X1 [Amphimedon queenslandica]|uniref:TRP C-terminal domain-containing protein n=1 Tax=Amphimedon queenslandica TaxID=400682 RepID=A0A1X7TZI5_AMPQE|nr:PREDICTED: uncharacterized protein LOC100631544 isoform X1 [Amphimedon queenslandica]|eukprot:XP_019856794.1 PREDICTED: uncharacterized protein LOC100631544 isoform X1 [Amphimedon queenslandica]